MRICLSLIHIFTIEKSKAYALKGNVRMQRLWQWVPNQLINFALWVPMIFLVLKAMGNAGFLGVLTSILTPIAKHLKVVSGCLLYTSICAAAADCGCASCAGHAHEMDFDIGCSCCLLYTSIPMKEAVVRQWWDGWSRSIGGILRWRSE